MLELCRCPNIYGPDCISDHFFITFTLHFATRVPPAPLPVTFRRNLRSLSPTHLSSVVSSSLPSPTHFTSLDVNAATDTLCSTLTSCLDDICPLSSRPARAAPSNPWLSDVLREHRTKLRAAERKWRKSNDPSDLTRYQSLLSSFSTEVHTAKSSHFHNKINSAPDMRNLFRAFNSLLWPPPPPPTTSITADDLPLFSQTKLEQSVTSSHLHTYRTSNQPHPLLKLPSSPSVPSPRRKYPNFSSPAILQHVLLTQSPLTFSKQSLPHSYRHSHTLSTHLSTLVSSPQRSSRPG